MSTSVRLEEDELPAEAWMVSYNRLSSFHDDLLVDWFADLTCLPAVLGSAMCYIQGRV